VLYGFPPGAHGRDTAFVQAYLSAVGDEELREQLRQQFLAIDGFVRQGQYTLDLPLNVQSLESAERALGLVWRLAGTLANEELESE